MNDSHLALIRQSLLVANNALKGQPEALFNKLGSNKAIKLKGIARRAARYQAIIDDYESRRSPSQGRKDNCTNAPTVVGQRILEGVH